MVSLRFLARRKTLTAIAVLTMALALGANTAAMSVLKAFLVSSLGVPEADRLFVIAPERNLPGRGSVVFNEAYPNYLLLRETQHAFAEITTYLSGSASWDDAGEVRPLSATRATATFFPTMRVQPALGRPFTKEDEGPNPKFVAVISHALWQSGLAGDPKVIGRLMTINGQPHTVVGVMPQGFGQPVPTDVWLPFDIPPQQRTAITGARQLTMLGRLRDGVSPEAGFKDLAVFDRRALEASPDNKDFRYNMNPLRGVLLNGADSTAKFVQAGAATLLLLAILNLASLLIAWGFERRQELAVRLALGANTGRVVRMLLEQAVIIVVAGGVMGIGLAYATLAALQQLDLGVAVNQLAAKAQLDPLVLLASFAVAVVAGLIAGAVPAWFSRGADLGDALRSSSRATTLSPAALRWQKGMVFAQAAVSIVILAATALIGVSYWNLSKVPGGFESRDRVVARITLPDAQYGTHGARAVFGAALTTNLAHEPEIASAGFTNAIPVGDAPWGARFFVAQPDGSMPKEPALLHVRRTSWTYRSTMGIPLLQGRDFTVHDDSAAPSVVMVSRALAARMWPNESAIGKQLLRVVTGNNPPLPATVVGVVGNTMDAGFSSPAGEAVYQPYSQVSVTRLTIVAQTRGNVQATLAAVRRALKVTDAVAAANSVTTLDAVVLQANALPRLRTLVLLLFAVVAVGMVALGSYGVMSQLVGNREREFAVRLVFGAEPRQLGSAVIAQVARLTVPGVLVGLAVVWSLSGALKAFVFGIEPRSAPVFVAIGAAVLVLSVLATLPSALRATRVDIRKGIGGS